MATFNVKFTKPDLKGMGRELKRQSAEMINQYLNRGIEEFATVAQNKVHVDTGMTLASLHALIDAIGDFPVFRQVKRNPYRPFKTLRGEVRKDKKTGPEEGYKAGLKAFKIKKANMTTMTFSFRYKIQVYQWNEWEDEWRALSEAAKTFRRYLRENKRKLEDELGRLVYRTYGTFIR